MYKQAVLFLLPGLGPLRREDAQFLGAAQPLQRQVPLYTDKMLKFDIATGFQNLVQRRPQLETSAKVTNLTKQVGTKDIGLALYSL